MKTILIIDDDQELCLLLANYLGKQGFQCRMAHQGQAGLALVRSPGADPLDLVILDVMMPGKNGFEVLKEMRISDRSLPVIMLTAKGEPSDRITGLELGADDYLPKPFEPRELLARIQAVMRRTEISPGPGQDQSQASLALDQIELNANTYQASIASRPLNLTPAEFKIIWLLLLTPGMVVARDTLFQKALGRAENIFDRSLDIHISHLRKKIGSTADGADRIKNIRGEGYLYIPSAGEKT